MHATKPSVSQDAHEIADRISREFNEKLCRFMGRSLLPMRTQDFRIKLEEARRRRTLA